MVKYTNKYKIIGADIMKKIAIPLLGILLLTGCSNKAYDDAMNEGKLAMASKDFNKADSMFSLAVEEKSSDKEAKALLSQTDKLIEATKLKDEGEIEKSKKVCEEILKIESESDVVKKAANVMLEEINKSIEENDKTKKSIESKISEAEELIDTYNYEDAKSKLNKISEEIENNKALKSYLNKIKELQKKCDDEIEAIKIKEESKKQEEDKKQAKAEEEKKNNPMYPMTASKALSILQNAYPDYTLTGGGDISYEAFNEVKGIDEPAYLYTFTSNETGDPYVGWVFADGAYKLRWAGWD